MKALIIIYLLISFLISWSINETNKFNISAIKVEKSDAERFKSDNYEINNYEIIDSIIDKNYGIIRLIRTVNNDIESANDSIFLFYTIDTNLIKLPLADVVFFNVSGKIHSNLFSYSKSSLLLVELEIDYHNGLGSDMATIGALRIKQNIIIDMSLKKVLFDCNPMNKDFSSTAKDTLIDKQITTIWVNDSSTYEYKFHLNDYCIILDSLTGNTTPDKAMGKYIFDNNKYIKQK